MLNKTPYKMNMTLAGCLANMIFDFWVAKILESIGVIR